jgi:hypothetical protein
VLTATAGIKVVIQRREARRPAAERGLVVSVVVRISVWPGG